ncbi:MAG TPA: DUF1189 family protein [Bacillales bacterium]|nr:DUF1189 family protein [Bacillales bacterium]
MTMGRIFLDGIRLPQKQAMFRLNRVRMGKTIAYFFLLMILVSLPEAVRFILAPHPELDEEIPLTLFILQFSVYYYLLFVFVGLLAVSVSAGFGKLFSTAAQRKLTYQQIWKVTAFALTGPLLLFTCAQSFGWQSSLLLLLLFLLTLSIVFRIILHFPRKQS